MRYSETFSFVPVHAPSLHSNKKRTDAYRTYQRYYDGAKHEAFTLPNAFIKYPYMTLQS